MLVFEYEACPGRVLFGAGARHQLAGEVDLLGVTRVLLVAGSSHQDLADEIHELLDGRAVGRFGDLVQHVPEAKALTARACARDLGADAILTIGGGTAIGFAKAIALEVPIPQIAVPTTYAGSEMTPFWGLSDGTRKWTGRDPAVQPKVVVYDPELTLSLPSSIAGPSGMNALAHAVEALYAPGANPVTSLLALEAVRVLTRALPTVCAHPGDLDARTEALYGAHLAGRALAVAGVSLHHTTCHVLGGMFGLDHSGTHAVVLAHALRCKEPSIPAAHGQLRAALDVEDPALAVFELARSIDAPRSLAELGMPESGLDAAAAAIVEAEGANGHEPERIHAMLRAAHRGDPPLVAEH